MKKFIVLTVLIVIVVGYFVLRGKNNLGQISSDITPEPSVEITETTQITPDDIFKEPVSFKFLNKPYTSDQNFSFKYPDNFKISAQNAEKGEIVTVENDKGTGFQIFVLPFNEKGPITPERIQKDLPDADIIDPKNAILDGVKTLVFYGYNEDMGETFEAWTVYKSKLYEISGPKLAEKLITETLETWAWK